MRGYRKWALAHSSSCCIIHIGIIQFLYNNCLFDFYFGLCYSRVVFTLEQELFALPEYLSASLVILCTLNKIVILDRVHYTITIFKSFYNYKILSEVTNRRRLIIQSSKKIHKKIRDKKENNGRHSTTPKTKDWATGNP
jgi:hypothetical protein